MPNDNGVQDTMQGMLDKLLTREVNARIEKELQVLLSASSVQAAIDKYVEQQLPRIVEAAVHNHFLRGWRNDDRSRATLEERVGNQVADVFRKASMRLEAAVHEELQKHLQFSLKVEKVEKS